ncbi:MAG: bifunctional phosphoribosylaminoimidazolecarboxamide formyltransferase/IMP cyclohydrolase [Candidatus Omnitrophica bacterium]|nr:bifunctional phosphoribosylaminoimidazolecarboxamide formyltransferase/IMP cyclohydrolase [Candidatus Omnitrophota bacterium]
MRRALLSVYDKRGIVPFAKTLVQLGVEILSTGKTAKLLKANRIPVTEVSDYTGFPELLDGRVKTLHPKIHAGILADRSNRSHRRSLRQQGIEPIDLVAVDLYPFEEGIGKGKMNLSKALELIDIGGVALLRAAAKNYRHVTVVPGCEFYEEVLRELKKNSGIQESANKKLAYQAFRRTCRYDRAIRDFFGEHGAELFPDVLELSFRKVQTLRYGENPHQSAAFYHDVEKGLSSGKFSLQGRPLSFNNLLDLDSAYRLVTDFRKPAVAIVKHAGPCGVGAGKTLEEAFQKAWESDPESAFGGVIGVNRTLGPSLAKQIVESGFLEVIGFPAIRPVALRVLKNKKNLRLVPFDTLKRAGKIQRAFKQVSGGLLVQTEDEREIRASQLKTVTKRRPTPQELRSLLFAFKVAKHVRSNAIVVAQGEATVGIGGGQPSRVGAVRLAIEKAGPRSEGAVLASDGFFPFPDNVEVAARAGIRAIIQPGGSIRDREVIEACDCSEIAMVVTNLRHFKH